MLVVLKYRVLKFELALEQSLGPGCVFRVRENPAAVVFGFDHKNAKSRDQYVIDLCGSFLQRKGHIVHQVVVRSREMAPNATSEQGLAAILERVRTRVRTIPSEGVAHSGSDEDIKECGQVLLGLALLIWLGQQDVTPHPRMVVQL